MSIVFELEQQEAEGLINIVGQLPTQSNAWPLLQKLIQQYQDGTMQPAAMPTKPENA